MLPSTVCIIIKVRIGVSLFGRLRPMRWRRISLPITVGCNIMTAAADPVSKEPDGWSVLRPGVNYHIIMWLLLLSLELSSSWIVTYVIASHYDYYTCHGAQYDDSGSKLFASFWSHLLVVKRFLYYVADWQTIVINMSDRDCVTDARLNVSWCGQWRRLKDARQTFSNMCMHANVNVFFTRFVTNSRRLVASKPNLTVNANIEFEIFFSYYNFVKCCTLADFFLYDN